MRNILIIGGGFAGVWAAMGAAGALEKADSAGDICITLISRDSWLTIRPRLYEENPDRMRVDLDAVLQPIGVHRVEGTVTSLDTAARTVSVGGQTISYDRLILAAGSQLHRPEIPGLKEYAFSVDTYEEAVRLDRHLATVKDRTIVVVGGGLTGLETATEMARRLEHGRVILIEREAHVGAGLGATLRPTIEEALRTDGVEVRTSTKVAQITADGVTLMTGEFIPAATVIWSAGVRANPLTQHLPVERDPLGRVAVDEHMQIRGLEGVLAAGDVALALADGVHHAPMTCQHAVPQGAVAGHNAVLSLLGQPLVPYTHSRLATCIDLGAWGGLFADGWDRQIWFTRKQGKAMKRLIMEYLIYPPASGRPAAICKAADVGSLIALKERGELQTWIERHISPRIALSCLRLLTACSAPFRTQRTSSRTPTSAGQSPAQSQNRHGSISARS